MKGFEKRFPIGKDYKYPSQCSEACRQRSSQTRKSQGGLSEACRQGGLSEACRQGGLSEACRQGSLYEAEQIRRERKVGWKEALKWISLFHEDCFRDAIRKELESDE